MTGYHTGLRSSRRRRSDGDASRTKPPRTGQHANTNDRLTRLHQTMGNQALSRLWSGHHSRGAVMEHNALTEAKDRIRTGGKPLDPTIRHRMESGFGRDLGEVRIHTDSGASASARGLGARAFTVGREIVFGAGQYQPTAPHGMRLLAHELAHTLQQRSSGPDPGITRSAAHESDAESASRAVTAGQTGVAVKSSTGPSVARQSNKPMTAAHAGGQMGEFDAAFMLGKMGFQIVMGPGGPGGHKLTARGFDIVAFKPATGELWIVDNKASGSLRNIQDATALTRNLKTNVTDAIRTISGMKNFQGKRAVLSRLSSTLTAIDSGGAIPSQVKLVITNAGGYAKGIGARLSGQGVIFVDMIGDAIRQTRKQDIARAKAAGKRPGRPTTHQKPVGKRPRTKSPPTKKTAPAVPTPKRTGFTASRRVRYPRTAPSATISSGRGGRVRYRGTGMAQLLPAAHQAFQDMVIRHAVATRLLGQWSTVEGFRKTNPGNFILVAVSLWEGLPQPAGTLRGVNYVEVYDGATKNDCIAKWQAKTRLAALGKHQKEIGPFFGFIDPSLPLKKAKQHAESQTCFIVTACYGSPLAPQVLLLRRFRDEALLACGSGRALVRLYYFVSPTIADFLARHDLARQLVRDLLVAPVVDLVRRFWSNGLSEHADSGQTRNYTSLSEGDNALWDTVNVTANMNREFSGDDRSSR